MATRAALKASKTLTADSKKGQELVATFRAQLNKANLDDEAGQLLVENKAFAAYLAEGFRRFSTKFDTAPWVAFYAKHFKATPDFSALHVPEKPNFSCRAVVVMPGLTNNQVFDACTKAFKTWRYADDLDTVRDVVKRPDGPYVVWVRDTVEVDAEMANKSANDIEAAGVNTLTLKERMLLEIAYFEGTGKHLDLDNVTLCAGSRYPDGDVPSCGWSRLLGDFSVRWYGAGDRSSDLRARVAVS